MPSSVARLYPPALLIALALLASSCQMFSGHATQADENLVRLQGRLSWVGGQWQLNDCRDNRPIKVVDGPVLGDAKMLLDGRDGTLLADLAGRREGDGSYQPQQFFRLQAGFKHCDGAPLQRLKLHAFGATPGWDIQVTAKGLILQQPGQDALALPYVEERLPGGGLDISSQANGRRLDLWVARQRCADGEHGALYGLAAQLRLDNRILRGCAYPGPLQSL